jgi:hypothetical protein
MSTAFSRSMLSLDADRFKASLLGLFLAAVLLVAWFLLAQGERRVSVDLRHVKGVVAVLTHAADLAEVLASGGVYHA